MYARITRSSVVVATLACTTLTGCFDEPTAPTIVPRPPRTAQPPQPALHGYVPRFDTRLTVAGDLKPGRPITITYTVAAKVSTPRAVLSLVMPELHFSRASGFRDTPAPLNQRVAPEVERVTSLARGASVTGSHTVTIPAAGYYRVFLMARHDGPVEIKSRTLSAAYQELWLLVTDDGGRVTTAFDSHVMPDDVRPSPGVFVAKRKSGDRMLPSRSSAGSAQGSGVAMSGGDPTFGIVKYFNYDVMQYRPVPEARIIAKVWSNFSGTYTGGEYYFVTDDNGVFDSSCPLDWEERWDLEISLWNNKLNIGPGALLATGSVSEGNCGTTTDYVLASEYAHVYVELKRIVPIAQAAFGRQRDAVPIDISGSIPNSRYRHFTAIWPWVDRIELRSGQIFGTGGQFTMAHEYGHAFHHRALGGIPEPWFSSLCGDNHTFTSVEGTQCAFVEGFADYFAVLTNGPATGLESAVEANFWFVNSFNPGDDGTHVESAVMAFLYDLTDSGAEAHDNLTLPASYIGNIIVACSAHTGNWGPARNIGMQALVWCFEQSVDQTARATYFPNFSINFVADGVNEPPGWSQSAIRTMWLRNLFDLAPGDPPPPPPQPWWVSIAGTQHAPTQQSCYFEATTNIEAPSFVWTVDGQVVSYDSYVWYAGPSRDPYTFVVQVTNYMGHSATREHYVNISEWGDCAY